MECTGCAGFCGDQELYLADMEVSRAGGAPIVMFRSWRCLIRHGINQHALTKESRPEVRCIECGRSAADNEEGNTCFAGRNRPFDSNMPVQCHGILIRRWD